MMKFTKAMNELVELVREPTVPRDVIDGLLPLLNKCGKPFFVKVPLTPAVLAGDPDGFLELTDIFHDLMAAFRAHDWPRVRIIQNSNSV